MAGALTIGDILKYILLLGQLAMPIRRFGMIANQISRCISAGERIFEILDTESPVKERAGARDVGKLTGQTFATLNQRHQQRETVESIREIAIHAMVIQQRGQGADQQTGEHRAHPVIRAADDGQCVQQDRLRDREARVVELAVQTSEEPTGQTGECASHASRRPAARLRAPITCAMQMPGLPVARA